MLTALDVVQTLNQMVTASANEPGNDQAALAPWLTSLADLKQSLQAGDQARAPVTLAALQTQLSNLKAGGKITAALDWRLNGGLAWISNQFEPLATPAVVPTPTPGNGAPVAPAPTAGATNIP